MSDDGSVIFVDVDGVLNHRAIFFVAGCGGGPLCPKAIDRLNRVVSETGCRLVMSSTWRLLDKLPEKVRDAGITAWHPDWRTIELRGEVVNGIYRYHKRGEEIAEWLSRHPEIKRYAIVDDDSDMLPEQELHFVQTSFDTGLLDGHADQLIGILGGVP